MSYVLYLNEESDITLLQCISFRQKYLVGSSGLDVDGSCCENEHERELDLVAELSQTLHTCATACRSTKSSTARTARTARMCPHLVILPVGGGCKHIGQDN